MKYYLVKNTETVINKNKPFYGIKIERFYGKKETVVGRKVLEWRGAYIDHIGETRITNYDIINYGFKRIQDAKRFITSHKRDSSENLNVFEIVEFDV